MTKSDDAKRSALSSHSGLVIRRAAAKYPRPASGLTQAAPVTIAPTSLEPIEIRTHRALLVQQGAIAARVAAQPDLAVMLLINPVLAFERMGVKMSAEIASHVLHTIQYPKAVRERRDVLEATLKKALGEPARPTDPVWNVHLLFELRKLAPLLIGALVPQYKPPIGEEESKPLQALRPAGTRRYTQPRLLAPRSRVGSVPWKESLRRMDLDAPAPKLEPADSTPLEVPLEDLWFYKDLDAIVHDALELGIIQRRAFPIHTPDSFRQILDGSKHNAFRLWIRSLRFKTEPR